MKSILLIVSSLIVTGQSYVVNNSPCAQPAVPRCGCQYAPANVGCAPAPPANVVCAPVGSIGCGYGPPASVGCGYPQAAVGCGYPQAAVGCGCAQAAVGCGYPQAAVGCGYPQAAIGCGCAQAPAVGCGCASAAGIGYAPAAAVQPCFDPYLPVASPASSIGALAPYLAPIAPCTCRCQYLKKIPIPPPCI